MHYIGANGYCKTCYQFSRKLELSQKEYELKVELHKLKTAPHFKAGTYIGEPLPPVSNKERPAEVKPE
jgi:hypothetical protein